MHPFASFVSLLALAASALAQATLGITDNVTSMASSRGSSSLANFNPVTVWNRIDKEKYAGWGYTDANPGFRTIRGMRYTLQDQDPTTQESYSLVFFTEDPARPNYPLVTAPVATVGPLPMFTASTSTPAAWVITTSFATPVLVPANADVFFGVELPTPFNANFTDGMSAHMVAGSVGHAGGLADYPGASAPVGLGFGGYYEATTQTLVYSAPLQRQYLFDPILEVGGVALTQHYGDSLHLAANNYPGTGCMFSSQYPDSASPSLNPGRADDLAMSWASAVADGTLVVFLADVAVTFGPEQPLSAYAPGSTGALCLNAQSMMVLGFSSTQGGKSAYQIVWGAAVRPLLPGLPLVQQGIAFDAANNRLVAGPAQISIL